MTTQTVRSTTEFILVCVALVLLYNLNIRVNYFISNISVHEKNIDLVDLKIYKNNENVVNIVFISCKLQRFLRCCQPPTSE